MRTQFLRDAAAACKVDVDAIALKVKQDFAASEKARLPKEATDESRCEGAAEKREESKAA